MTRLGAKYIRIMSFKPGDNDDKTPAVVFDRVREVTKMFLDAGLQPEKLGGEVLKCPSLGA